MQAIGLVGDGLNDRVKKGGDAMCGDPARGSNRIPSISNPTDEQDAATKNYVDTTCLRKGGGPLSWDLEMLGNRITSLGEPTSSQNAATKTYVDTRNNLQALKAGDTMTVVLTVDTSSGGGIRLWNAADTKFYQLGISSGNLELRHMDNALSTTTAFEAAGGRLTSLFDPVNPQKAATNNYVNRPSHRTYITVWAEENSEMNLGEYEWSFGNGSSGSDHGQIGHTMLAPGRIVREGLFCDYRFRPPPSALRVNIVVNGQVQNQFGVIKPQALYSGTAIFGCPLELLRGDRINFQSDTTNASVPRAVVSLLIELDL